MGNRTVDMTTGSPAKHILNFAVPLILTNVGSVTKESPIVPFVSMFFPVFMIQSRKQ